jgi:branched-chain amino acid transport system ATP-binding protein
MPMPAASLEVERLSAGYGPTVVLEEVSFAVPAGRRLSVLGRNGMGKTTLLAALMGLNRHHGGAIRVDGVDFAGRRPDACARGGIGLVPQTREVFATLTVEENLFVGLKGRPRAALAEAFELFPRLAERRRNLGWQLSGGEQQMLTTARTLLGKPSVLLLDEPLEGLAPVICDELMAVLIRLAEAGEMTVVFVEQRLDSALAFAPEAMILERGRIAWAGPSADLKASPEIVERHLGVGGLH